MLTGPPTNNRCRRGAFTRRGGGWGAVLELACYQRQPIGEHMVPSRPAPSSPAGAPGCQFWCGGGELVVGGLMELRRERRERPGREEGNGQNGPEGREHGRERRGNDEKTVRGTRERKGKMGKRRNGGV